MRRTVALVTLATFAAWALALPAVAGAIPLPQAPVAPSPLASNGFESPSCTSPALSAQLTAVERSDCAISGLAIAPVPLANYAVDLDIPSGLGASFSEDVDTVVQDLLVTPVWTALVWLVHVVLIALEWCYSLELLTPATLARAAGVLGGATRVFTDPWLGLVLAVAAVGFAWQGLVRRRVLDTLGRAALLVVMVSGGLFVIADPGGTVGALGGLADSAALATVSASATGDPSRPVASVDGAFGQVFAAAIDGPWCYLEFGDVEWCEQPAQLDAGLRATGNRLESIYRAADLCHGPVQGLVQCAPAGSAYQREVAGAWAALAAARTNGALFLAIPDGTLGRTSLSTTPSLYATLCGASDPTQCTAPTAPQSEFRTAPGTWPRVGGLLLIAAGTLGMLLLFGFLALRLLGAALATLLYLLLAPLAVLAPALGDGGRDAFRLWALRLLGAVLSKLVYSVALGVVLMVVGLLESLDTLGWWTQWLLVSVFWWTAFEHRHRILGLVLHERGEPARRSPLATRLFVASRAARAGTGVLRAPRDVAARGALLAAEIVRRRGAEPRGPRIPAPVRDERAQRGRARGQARAELRAQVTQSAAPERRVGPIAALEARRERIAAALVQARFGGDRRREVSLGLRAQRVQAQIAGARAPARVVPARIRRMLDDRTRARALDRAARAPSGDPLRSPARTPALARLANLTAAEYGRRDAPGRRAARVEIERALERRRELLAQARPTPLRVMRDALRRERPARPPQEAVRLARRRRQFGRSTEE